LEVRVDTLVLSRIQFGLTISFHYVFPPLSIGLGLLLVFMEGMYLKTKDPLYEHLTRFWVRVFGLIYSLGVATGIVMEFQFGTNWSAYSRFVGDIFGSALAAEGIFAFFLESGFLAILLFGWNRVSKRMHFFSTLMVALGAHFSALWIVVANSWQQTPAGYQIVSHGGGSRAEITSFRQLVFNPSSMDRLFHVLLGAWQTAAFFVLSVGAWYLLKKRHEDFARATMKIGLAAAGIASLLQLVSGDDSAKGVARYQPAKLAAFEGHYADGTPGDMYLFGWVDEKEERVKMGIAVPGMLSYLMEGSASAPLKGLKSFPPEDRPPVNPVFQSYHLMVGIGMALIGIAWLSIFFWWRKTLWKKRWLLWILVFSVLGPQVANQAGWFSAEVGRQPWVVYGLLRTADGFSPGVSPGEVWFSLLLFGAIYLLLFILFIYLLNEKIQHGPMDGATVEAEGRHRA
jgi:cytochrome d ubiquinol oxidase subunit I